MSNRPLRIACFALVSCALALTACEGNPRPIGIVQRLGDVAYANGDYPKAEIEFLEVIERRPERWYARRDLGSIYVSQERFAEARDQLDIAYTLAPEDDDVLELYARTLIELGETDQAIDELGRVARTNNTPRDWNRLGRFLSRIGDHDRAEAALLTAARLDNGESADIQRALGHMYQRAGDNTQAIERYRMTLYLDPEDRWAARQLRALGQVPGPTIALRPTEQTHNHESHN